jgi:hypothetical protein
MTAITFNTGKPCNHGHTSDRYMVGNACIECVRVNNKIKNNRNKEDRKKRLQLWLANNRDRSNEWRRNWLKNNPTKTMVTSARRTAKLKGLPFDLTDSDITIPEFCPVLGLLLEKGKVVRSDNSPSLDRIIPSNGYVKGNVLVISMRANRIKNDASIDELRAIADFYSQLFNKN